MPAQRRDGAGVIDRRVRQRLELGDERVALLVGQLQLVDAFGDRQAVKARQPVERRQRACGCGSASRTPSTNWSQPRRTIASRSAIVPSRRSPPTYQLARSVSPETVTVSPARVSSENVWGWCQWTQAPPYSIAWPSQVALQVRPPSRSRASSSRTLRPRNAASRAAVTPAKPPPITSTSVIAPGSGSPARRAGAGPTRRARSPRARPTSTGLHSTSSSERSTSTSPIDLARATSASTSTPGRPRPPNSSEAPRRPASPARIRASSSGNGSTQTSSSSSVQIPPSPITSAGTIPSRWAATISSTPPGAAIRSASTTPPCSSASGASDANATATSSSAARPSAIPPMSDLCCTEAALSFSAIVPPSAARAATAASSESTTTPSATGTPASRSSALASCSASHGPTPAAERAGSHGRAPARRRRDRSQPLPVGLAPSDAEHRRRAAQAGPQSGDGRHAGPDHLPGGAVVEQLRQRRGHQRRYRAARGAEHHPLADRRPALGRGALHPVRLVVEDEHETDAGSDPSATHELGQRLDLAPDHGGVVERVGGRRRRRQQLRQPRQRRRRQRRQRQAQPLRLVGALGRVAARAGHDRQARRARGRGRRGVPARHRQRLGQLQQLVHVGRPDRAGLLDQAAEHPLIAGQRAAVGAGGRRARRGAPDLQHDHRHRDVRAGRQPVAQPRAAVVLQIQRDRADVAGRGQPRQVVGGVEHRLVARRDHRVEPQAPPRRQRVDRDVAALRDERHPAGRGDLQRVAPQRHPAPRRDDPVAVGAADRQPVASRRVDERRLQRIAGSNLAEAGAEHDRAAATAGAGLLDRRPAPRRPGSRRSPRRRLRAARRPTARTGSRAPRSGAG